MDHTHELVIDRPLATVWPVLVDLRALAQALPGATIEDAESDGTFRGVFKIKLGAFTAAFRGQASYASVEHDRHRFVLEGAGSSAHGNAVLRVEGLAEERPGSTTGLRLTSSIDLTGRLAQFGSSMADDVVGRLMDAFAHNLVQGFVSERPKDVESPRTGAEKMPEAAGFSVGASGPADTTSFDLGGSLLPKLERLPRVALAGALGVLVGVVIGRSRQWRSPLRAVIVITGTESAGAA